MIKRTFNFDVVTYAWLDHEYKSQDTKHYQKSVRNTKKLMNFVVKSYNPIF